MITTAKPFVWSNKSQRVETQVHPELKALLDIAPRRHGTILVTEYGKPFTLDGYGIGLAGR